MYIMPQHLQGYKFTAQGDICLCETIVLPLWFQKNMEESANDQGHTSRKYAAFFCHPFQW